MRAKLDENRKKAWLGREDGTNDPIELRFDPISGGILAEVYAVSDYTHQDLTIKRDENRVNVTMATKDATSGTASDGTPLGLLLSLTYAVNTPVVLGDPYPLAIEPTTGYLLAKIV